jgi:hypothetical protein
MTPPQPQGRSFLFTDCLIGMGAIVGAIGTPVWGYTRFGIIGAVLGVPVGAVLGFLGMLALLVTVALLVVGVVSAWAYLRHGRRGLQLLYQYGPDAVKKGEPPPATGANQTNEASG